MNVYRNFQIRWNRKRCNNGLDKHQAIVATYQPEAVCLGRTACHFVNVVTLLLDTGNHISRCALTVTKPALIARNQCARFADGCQPLLGILNGFLFIFFGGEDIKMHNASIGSFNISIVNVYFHNQLIKKN